MGPSPVQDRLSRAVLQPPSQCGNGCSILIQCLGCPCTAADLAEPTMQACTLFTACRLVSEAEKENALDGQTPGLLTALFGALYTLAKEKINDSANVAMLAIWVDFLMIFTLILMPEYPWEVDPNLWCVVHNCICFLCQRAGLTVCLTGTAGSTKCFTTFRSICQLPTR